MRAPSATLATAQSAVERTPYIHMSFVLPDDSLVNLSMDSLTYGNRILSIDQYEEAYNGYAIVVLRDTDRDIPDLRGARVTIGYGDTTTGGDEYANSETPLLWVVAQTTIYASGQALVMLELEDIWAMLRRIMFTKGDPITDYSPGTLYDEASMGSNMTVYDLLEYIIETVADGQVPYFTLDALTVDDGIINTREPLIEINNTETIFEDCASLVYRLITMTRCCLRADPAGHFTVVYPQSSDAANITFYNNQAPYFYEYHRREAHTLPNHVILFYNNDPDTNWASVAAVEDTDAASVTAHGDVYYFVAAPEITASASATERVGVIVDRLAFETDSGKLIIPHDCRIELYDKVAVNVA